MHEWANLVGVLIGFWFTKIYEDLTKKKGFYIIVWDLIIN